MVDILTNIWYNMQYKKENWYNPKTGEKWNADLGHGDPIGPHWDYTDKNGNKFRVFPDGRVEKK